MSKVLIKKKGEGVYWWSVGGWTQDFAQAQDFKSFLVALEYCEERRLREVDAVFWFSDSQRNLVLRLH